MSIGVQRSTIDTQKFWIDFRRATCERIREDVHYANDAWSALTNTTWKNDEGQVASMSFRSAGVLIADMRGEFDPEPNGSGENVAYLRYYMASTEGVVANWIRDALKAAGWSAYDREGNQL